MRKRSWASAGALLAAVTALAGCAGGGEEGGDATLTVYVSLPLRSADGRDAADGARMALAEAGSEAAGASVTAEFLDGWDPGDRWSPERAAANARAATQDSTAIAYLGDFESGATRASLPVTNEARLLQVSPAAAADDLVALPGTNDLPETQPSGTRTFGRVIPSDTAQGEAGGAWAGELGWRSLRVVSDGTGFGDSLADGFEAAYDGARGGELRYLAGYPRSFTSLRGARAGSGDPRQMTSDAVLAAPTRRRAFAYATSAALDPSQLPEPGQEFAQRFEDEYDRAPGRYAAYGYEAMALILDSIERAGDPLDRASVVDAFFAAGERDSILGAYSIDALGDTTLDRMTGYRLGRGPRPEAVAELSGSG